MERINIEDFHMPELDVYARLNEVQLRRYHEPGRGIFIAESPNVILRALEAGCVPVSVLMEDKPARQETEEILRRCGDIPVYTAKLAVLKQLTGFCMTRGMLCAMYRPEPSSVEEVCREAKRIAVMEQVVNPANVGAIFRSAAALDMDGVLLTSGCSDPLYRRAVRVSMGTVFQIPWAYLEEGVSIHERLKGLGFSTAAMALCDDSIPVDDERLRKEERLAVILGTEGEGLLPGTIAECDYTVRIPMSHGVDSLNVAAASAVVFWEVSGRERQSFRKGGVSGHENGGSAGTI